MQSYLKSYQYGERRKNQSKALSNSGHVRGRSSKGQSIWALIHLVMVHTDTGSSMHYCYQNSVHPVECVLCPLSISSAVLLLSSSLLNALMVCSCVYEQQHKFFIVPCTCHCLLDPFLVYVCSFVRVCVCVCVHECIVKVSYQLN